MGEGEHRIALTIGTAGHVDHGKTTLVRYMTGTDTDRLEEEHRRGISIVPGYAELELPGGRRASLVDVPGHERFVKNMVSGSTGVDAFLLVVAADDGVMPQTREHLDVLRVLGVEQGVVALSKIDAVDEETVELAALEVEELLETGGMEAPIIHVSGATGEGVEDCCGARRGGRDTADRRSGDLARLPVDRAFVLKGIGVVVTGTLWSGEIRPGDTLHTAAGLRPRVRGVQNHGHPAEVAHAGARTALDLTGVESSRDRRRRSPALRPVPASRALDARIWLLENAKPLEHGTRQAVPRHPRHERPPQALGRGEDDGAASLRLEDPSSCRATGSCSAPRKVTVGGGAVLDPSAGGRRPDPSGWRPWRVATRAGPFRSPSPETPRRHDHGGALARPRPRPVKYPPPWRARG